MTMQGRIKTDVLIIGSGGAGCRAAIEASKVVDNVLVVSKGPVGRSGLTPMSMPACAAVMATKDKKDSPDIHFQDTLKGGYHLSNKKLLRYFVDHAPKEVTFLENLGIRFDRTDDDEIVQSPAQGHSHPRICLLDDNLGRVLLNLLKMEMSRLGVRVLEDCFITDLLVEENQVRGACGIDWDTGEFVSIAAKAVVIATGGMEALYPFRSTNPRATGDGIALAYRAGTEIMDIEFMQFTPYVFVWPKSVRGVCVPADVLLITMGAKYLNNRGERFLRNYDPERMEMTTRDILSRAMFMEIAAGRGSDHGGVYLDCRELSKYEGKSPEEVINLFGGCVADYIKIAGIDVLTQVVEVAPAAHFGMGGICINEEASSSIQGLYAAGEVAGGVHGANRLAANSIPEVLVFGALAGEQAGRFAQEVGSLNEDIVWQKGSEKAQQSFTLLNEANGRSSVHELKIEFEKIMFNYLGIVRVKKGMEKAIEELDKLENRFSRDILIKDKSPVANYDWLETLELKNMFIVSKILGICSLNRKESRGVYYREDYPEMLPDWQVNTVVYLREGKLEVTLRDPDERW